MKSLYFSLLVLLLAGSLVIAQRGRLLVPRALGNVQGYDIASIVLEYEYDPTVNRFELARARIAALEGEVLDEGLATERFQVHPGGEGYTVEAADLPANFKATAEALQQRANDQYKARRGY